MCPGGSDDALDVVMPLLKKIAARGPTGEPCVARVGYGGCGHYVKMIHNGIEHGMMSAVAEAWQIMNDGLGMSFEDIASVFEKWSSAGELVSTGATVSPD